MRFVSLPVVIYLVGLGARFRIPHHWAPPAKIEDLLLSIENGALGDGVPVALVVLEGAFLRHAIDVLRVLQEIRSSRLAGGDAWGVSVGYGRFDFNPHAVGGVEGLHAIAFSEEQGVHSRRANGLFVGAALGANRGNGHYCFAGSFSVFDVLSIREELQSHALGGKFSRGGIRGVACRRGRVKLQHSIALSGDRFNGVRWRALRKYGFNGVGAGLSYGFGSQRAR